MAANRLMGACIQLVVPHVLNKVFPDYLSRLFTQFFSVAEQLTLVGFWLEELELC